MTRPRSHTTNDKIHEALKKLKSESNAKELELIDLVASIYETVKEQKDKAMDQVQEKASAVNTSVHLHPWYYIGGAAACGLLTGFLLGRR